MAAQRSHSVLQAERAAAEKAEEERYRQQLMAQFAEQDKLEQMSAQKRRLRLEEHKREAARLVAVKQAAVAAAKVPVLTVWLHFELGRETGLRCLTHLSILKAWASFGNAISVQ